MSTANRQITSEMSVDPLAVIPAKTLGTVRLRAPSSVNAFTILPGSNNRRIHEVVSAGSRYHRRTDVTARSDCTALIEHAIARFERIDILVNNAGIVHGAEFLDLAEEDFD